jgi:hypothetical protein
MPNRRFFGEFSAGVRVAVETLGRIGEESETEALCNVTDGYTRRARLCIGKACWPLVETRA